MIVKNDLKHALFVFMCMLLNVFGRYLAEGLHLPLWLDSLGTVIASYRYGYVCGSIVGVVMNIVCSDVDSIAYIYSVNSIAISIIVGILSKKRWFNSLFGTLSASVLLTLVSVFVSVIINWIFAEGMTGNIWGDGVIKYLEEQGVPIFASSVTGQFYIDFLDKVVTLLLMYLGLKCWRKRRRIYRKFFKKNTVKIIFAALVFSGLSSQTKVFAQIPDFNSYVQTIYSSSNGLPCGEANDIAQTPDGILWIGTYAGLYRYNGSEFRWMKDYESVRNVNCLYVDEEGRLWIGTNDNGLSIFIDKKIVNTIDSSNGLPSDSVRAIIKGADGYYYVGTSIGILVLELNSGLRVCNIIKDAGYTVSLSADEEGFVSAVSSSGKVFILNESEVRFSFTLNSDNELFTCCTFDKNGILYAGTSRNNIYRYEVSEGNVTLIDRQNCSSLNYINKIFFDGDRTFICADNGIAYFDAGNNLRILKTGNFNNSIDSMTIDYQGNYWFTSSRKGLLRLSASSFTNLYGAMGLLPKVVNSVTVWNDSIYAATDKGLDIFKGERKIESPLSKRVEGVRIRCLLKDSRDHLWLCTYGNGILESDKNGNIRTYTAADGLISNRMRVAIELKDGSIAAAGETGITYIKDNKVTKSIKYNSDFTDATILTLMELFDGTLLAGTDGNGMAIIKNGEIKRTLTLRDGLTSGVILRTVKEKNGSGVFIVSSNSICYMNNNFEIKRIKKFPYFNNYDICANDNGNLFVLGSAGIYVVSQESLLADTGVIQYDLLDAKSGLNTSLTVNSWNYKSPDGKLYLSTSSGVYIVDMNNYIFGKRSYRMMVSSVNVDSVPFSIERSEPLIIARNNSKIEIFPEVVNYTVMDPLVSCQLVGFDKQEKIIPQSQLSAIVYTNLPSGKYTFNLAVLDKNLSVIEKSSYEIIKEKEIYDESYFKIYLLLVAIIAVAWLTWFFVRTQIQRTINIQRQQLEFARKQVEMGNSTVLAIAKAVDAKDVNTSQHSHRVSEYAVMIAEELGMGEKERENLRKAALLHDIGKIGIPDRILNKPGKLTDEEYAIMKTHVTRGAEILKDFTMIDHVSDGVLYHHERWDGKGYAKGLKGEEIPLYGRIIGVADAFDAMTANRVYRKQLDIDYVINEFKRCRGSQFDPKMADIMLHLIESGKVNVEALYEKNSAGKNKGEEL